MDVDAVAERILSALKSAGAPNWSVCGFPDQREAWIGPHFVRPVIVLREREGVVHLNVDGSSTSGEPSTDVEASSPNDLEGALPLIVERARWWFGRLMAEDLRPGERYRVRREFDDKAGARLARGLLLTFDRVEEVANPDDDWGPPLRIYYFRGDLDALHAMGTYVNVPGLENLLPWARYLSEVLERAT